MPARGMSAKCPLLRRDLGAKVAKEKDTPCHGLRLPARLDNPSGCVPARGIPNITNC